MQVSPRRDPAPATAPLPAVCSSATIHTGSISPVNARRRALLVGQIDAPRRTMRQPLRAVSLERRSKERLRGCHRSVCDRRRREYEQDDRERRNREHDARRGWTDRTPEPARPKYIQLDDPQIIIGSHALARTPMTEGHRDLQHGGSKDIELGEEAGERGTPASENIIVARKKAMVGSVAPGPRDRPSSRPRGLRAHEQNSGEGSQRHHHVDRHIDDDALHALDRCPPASPTSAYPIWPIAE